MDDVVLAVIRPEVLVARSVLELDDAVPVAMRTRIEDPSRGPRRSQSRRLGAPLRVARRALVVLEMDDASSPLFSSLSSWGFQRTGAKVSLEARPRRSSASGVLRSRHRAGCQTKKS